MKKNFTIAVVLAGGIGKRLYPLSSSQNPKQFLKILPDGNSLLQSAVNRFNLNPKVNEVWISTGIYFAEKVREKISPSSFENLLVEKVSRGTNAAIIWSVLKIAEKYGSDTVAIFSPADQWMDDAESFVQTISAATETALQKAAVVLLGIRPGYASTEFGYIEMTSDSNSDGIQAHKIKNFVEKPDRKTAEKLILDKNHLWNSGILISKIGILLNEIYKHDPVTFEIFREKGENAFEHLLEKSFEKAVLEKIEEAYVLPAEFGWHDLGNWKSLEDFLRKYPLSFEQKNHFNFE
jgi:mannose-1-phosphate guanylyltransferase